MFFRNFVAFSMFQRFLAIWSLVPLSFLFFFVFFFFFFCFVFFYPLSFLKPAWTFGSGKSLKRWEYQTTLLAAWHICMQGKKQQLERDIEQRTGSKFAEEYVKAVYCHPAYLTYMQSTSCKIPGWIKHKLESRLLSKISVTSNMQMTPPLWQKASWWK